MVVEALAPQPPCRRHAVTDFGALAARVVAMVTLLPMGC